ncbi:hypothetical protein IVA88_20640 [Bradyrhizobium sp. 149]|uniref:hypothetical protein n=1 Tax=Bradyrhizobium sp. 149 TaxID=2782624 RepID=UPI001FFA051D|nr:hypothetical protein [Bradyrhizobium sp. 149]MCK1653831.1 hypothetical protein [Bradyrhizobium sp. 149]
MAKIYSERSDDNLTTFSGRDLKENASTRALAFGALVHGLEIFGYAYNLITDHIPAFVEACEASLADRRLESLSHHVVDSGQWPQTKSSYGDTALNSASH